MKVAKYRECVLLSPHFLQAPGAVDVEVKVVEKLQQGSNLLCIS